ncbi:hypothetical protein K445DRAFT_319942 [Daldinia sp. EC12]|nr:hypothetical protein K445DRAFT_319942 [Daldinia sp. EC12]
MVLWHELVSYISRRYRSSAKILRDLNDGEIYSAPLLHSSTDDNERTYEVRDSLSLCPRNLDILLDWHHSHEMSIGIGSSSELDLDPKIVCIPDEM